MTMFAVKVTQVFRVEREIIVEVDADDEDEARESIDEVPNWDDDRWEEEWDLQNEEYEIV